MRAANGKIARRAGLAVSAITLACASLLAGCGSSPSDDAAPTSTTATSTIAGDEAKVLADYRAFWDMYLSVGNPVTIDSPLLPAHATGDELKLLVQQLNLAKSHGEVWKGSLDLNPRVTSISSDRATVRDCLLDNTGSYKAADGTRVDTPDSTRQLDVFDMRLIDGTWKVNLITKERDGCTEP